jgi:hypothetical protein
VKKLIALALVALFLGSTIGCGKPTSGPSPKAGGGAMDTSKDTKK